MKLRNILALALSAVMTLGLLADCGQSAESGSSASEQAAAPAGSSSSAAPAADAPAAEPGVRPAPIDPAKYGEYGLDENLRFLETRKITVEVWNRENDGGSDPVNNVYTSYLKEKVLEKHNIEVEFIDIVRASEDTTLATHLAAGTAPDVAATFSWPNIQTYGEMGGVLDLYPMLTELESWFPNLYGLLGDANVFYRQDPLDNHIWAIEALLQDNWSVNTFVRKDWLDKLGLAEPTSLQEFEDMLVAFKDNAATLMPANPDGVIPYAHTFDIRWNMRPIIDGFLPDDWNDKDRYINEFVDAWIATPATKEAAAVYNKWYNMDLTWKDFSLYNANTLGSVFDDLCKAGLVGAFSGNVDTPYRNGEDSFTSQLARTVGPEAMYVSVNSFPNAAGNVVRMVGAPIDRKVFLPSTNDEPIASLLYLDFISDLETRKYLQIGEEGVTHTTNPDGTVVAVAVTGESIMNSPRNVDYTFTINGLDLGDPTLNASSLALGYPGTPPEFVAKSITDMVTARRPAPAVNVGTIESEVGILADMNEKRDAMFVQAIVAPTPEEFSAVYDASLQDIMDTGGAAIMEERKAKWEQFYGDALNLD